jgi:CubicO group peptidase (beta-lactamase class C family)
MNARTPLADIAADLDAYAEHARVAWDLPALALAITDETGSITRFAGAGSVAVGEQRPPTPRTGWRVASITKTITATAIFQLRDRGLLDLDDPLARHVPEFAAARPTAGRLDDVTLRRMLTHRSGLTTEAPLPSWSSLRFPPMAEMLAAMGTAEVAVAPGSRFKYSNFAFGMLGEVVTRVSGVPYEAYVQREIFGPLGMDDSTFEPDGRDGVARVADSHVVSRPLGGAHRPAPYVGLAGLSAAGQLITTAADLARWTAAQFAGGPAPHVLGDASLGEMQAATDAIAGPDNVRTLGWELTTDLGGPVHGHGGGLFGFGSYLAFHAPSRTGVIALSNLWPSRGAAGHIAAELFGQMLGGARPKPEVPRVPDADGSPVPDAARRFLGSWFAEPGFPVLIEWRGGGLWLLAGDSGEYSLHTPTPLTIEGPDALRARDGRAAGEILRFSGDGPSGWLQFEVGGFIYERV